MAEVDSSLAPTLPTSLDSEETSTALATTNNTQTVAVGDGEVKKTKKIIRRKRRPARPQVDPEDVKSEPPPQTGTIFNIWYNKWSGGDREDKYLSQTHAAGRCNVAQDSGYTRGDRIPGSYFCLFFARGLCPRGHECEYLHRLPGLHDHFNPNVDSFGRDKHNEYRDDMGGVGSFNRVNRTLYVGRIHVTDDIEEVVARHFAEWGEVERIRVLTGRGVGFVTYVNEANAQFAKEAMAHQSLDHNEILNVRWATQDPNPLAQKREARRIEEMAAEAVRRALPAEFVAEIEGRDPESVKRQRLEGSYSSYALDEAKKGGPIEGAGQTNSLEPQEDGGTGVSIEAAIQRENDADPEAPIQEGGILSGSTLAALKGYSVRKAGEIDTTKIGSGLTGSLVGYDSDEESD